MNPRPAFASFVFTSAVLMCLGWGLRGYIGGGPLGAMIPGAFIALWLCILLGIDGRRAALVAAFGAVGIGIGGEMTYGQTLGLLRSNDTVAWGLLGTVVKGGVWGLLGGALLGLGFVVQRLSFKQVALALLACACAMVVGIALINQPKLIYFSDPINKPRDEVWAGLLFGAVALLLVLKRYKEIQVPGWFALYGTVGGMAGFGIGGALMALGSRVEPPLRGLPWWKFMEFTFGACLGLAFGACALHLRKVLSEKLEAEAVPVVVPWRALGGAVVMLGLGLVAWEATAEHLVTAASESALRSALLPFAMVLLGYSTLAFVLMLLSLRYTTLAWQTALTMTFIATIIDLQDDLAGENGILVAASIRWAFVWSTLIVSALLVLAWQRSTAPRLQSALLALMWACTAVAYARILVSPSVLAPAADVTASLPMRFVAELEGHGIVHGIFTACAVYATVAIYLHAGSTVTGADGFPDRKHVD